MEKIYLDYAATAPTDPAVIRAMEPFFFERFGNASSAHSFGQEAKKAAEDARQAVAGFIHAKPEEIIFTSGGSESNNHAIFGVADALSSKGNHIIVSNIEHHSVSKTVEHLEKKGLKVTRVSVNTDGLIDPEDVKKAVTDKTILISVMHANNEIGTIQPVAEIGKIAKGKNIYFHCDAVQTVGHLPLDVRELNIDFLSFSGHKFCGPKGVGALYMRKGVKALKFIHGGDQERERRASTLNLPGIVGLGKALEICKEKMAEEIKTQTFLRDKIIQEIKKRIPDSFLNGHRVQRLPNNVNVAFNGVDGEALLMSLDMAGIAVSMGSACTAAARLPSYTLRAIGLSDELAFSAIRITVGRWTDEQQVDSFLNHLVPMVERLRSMSASYHKP